MIWPDEHETWLKAHVYLQRMKKIISVPLGWTFGKANRKLCFICLKSGWTFVSSQDPIWSQNLIEKTSISQFWIGGLTLRSLVQNNKHTTISEAKVGWFPTTLVINWNFCHTPPPEKITCHLKRDDFKRKIVFEIFEPTSLSCVGSISTNKKLPRCQLDHLLMVQTCCRPLMYKTTQSTHKKLEKWCQPCLGAAAFLFFMTRQHGPWTTRLPPTSRTSKLLSGRGSFCHRIHVRHVFTYTNGRSSIEHVAKYTVRPMDPMCLGMVPFWSAANH